MDAPSPASLNFLLGARVAALDHSSSSLLDHLLGTRALLAAWGARRPVCDAGLFHSVYSTEAFAPMSVPLDQRDRVREVIGEEAERLAWLFCIMERASFDANMSRVEGLAVIHRLTGEQIPLSREEFEDLVNVSCANTLEAIPRLPWDQRRRCRAYLARYAPVALPAAIAALDASGGAWWQIWR
jgi:hypothetical protein